MKNLKYIIPLAFICSNAYSADFCQQLYNKLNSENHSQSIIQKVLYNYSVFNHQNFENIFEFKYDTEQTIGNSNNYFDLTNDELTSENFNNYFPSSSKQNNEYLKDCNSSGNFALFSIKMVDPGLMINGEPYIKQPKFNIYFLRSNGSWYVNDVQSLNFNSLYYQHLVNSFRYLETRKLNKYSDNFYNNGLKNMVENDVYPAVTSKLKQYFNSKIINCN